MSIFEGAHVDWPGVIGLLDLIIAFVSNFCFKSNIKAETLRNGGYMLFFVSTCCLIIPLQDFCTEMKILIISHMVFSVGDVYIGVMDRGGQLEVEITQARGLTPKPGSKTISGNPRLKITVLNHFIHIICLARP